MFPKGLLFIGIGIPGSASILLLDTVFMMHPIVNGEGSQIEPERLYAKYYYLLASWISLMFYWHVSCFLRNGTAC